MPEGTGRNSLRQHQSTALLCWPGRERRERYYFGLAEAAVAGFRIPVPQVIFVEQLLNSYGLLLVKVQLFLN